MQETVRARFRPVQPVTNHADALALFEKRKLAERAAVSEQVPATAPAVEAKKTKLSLLFEYEDPEYARQKVYKLVLDKILSEPRYVRKGNGSVLFCFCFSFISAAVLVIRSATDIDVYEHIGDLPPKPVRHSW